MNSENAPARFFRKIKSRKIIIQVHGPTKFVLFRIFRRLSCQFRVTKAWIFSKRLCINLFLFDTALKVLYKLISRLPESTDQGELMWACGLT